MREFIAGVMGCVLTTGLLVGCASGPTQEELAAKVEAERQEAIQKRAEDERKRAETARKEAELKAILAKVSALEQAGQALEANGKLREAFKQYLAALEALNKAQAPEVETRLRERIIKIALRLDPAPAVPQEAERYMVFGGTALKDAKTADDYKRAGAEFDKALRAAPWWGAAYFNLGIVQEKMGEYEDSIRNLSLYLSASPDAPDANTVRANIYEMEFKLKKPLAERAAGLWLVQSDKSQVGWMTVAYTDGYTKLRVENVGDKVKVFRLLPDREMLYFQGSVEGTKITATYDLHVLYQCGGYSSQTHSTVRCSFQQTWPLVGEISKDAKSMVLNFQGPAKVEIDYSLLTNTVKFYEKSKELTWVKIQLKREE